MFYALKIFVFSVISICLTSVQGMAENSGLTFEFSKTGAKYVMTDAELASLAQVSIKTTTPWETGKTQFEGPLLKDVLDAVNASTSNLTLVALNDYKVQIPEEYIQDKWPIIARLKNGKPMSIRDKGPYWLIFPFDKYKKLQNQLIYSYSIWQLSKIIVE